MHDVISSLFLNYTFLIVIIGTSIIGSVAGSLGVFAVLRRQSLLGDCIAHAALPGICIAFLISVSKQSWTLLAGAIVAGVIGALLLHLIQEYSELKRDAALGIILSVFFGFGLVLLTYIQSQEISEQSGLNVYLFGNAATLLRNDIYVMGSLGIVVILFLILFWKEFKVVSFDKDFASTLGFPQKRIDFFITFLTVISIVVGLQAVGVVLMSALIIAPAVAARQWTDQLYKMVMLSALFGILSSVSGVIISSLYEKMPTGPVIVIMVSIIVVISLFFAPKRGIFVSYIRHINQKLTIHSDRVLLNLYQFSEVQKDPTFAHDITVLDFVGEGSTLSILNKLKNKKLVYNPRNGYWGLSIKGVKYVKNLLKETKNA
jgi:manganese/zinc/iron transport system permease protein